MVREPRGGSPRRSAACGAGGFDGGAESDAGLVDTLRMQLGEAQTRAAQLPAPRLSGYSRDDALSNLAFFFGDPVVPERLRDYSEHHAM